ncbi:TPA: hypothetical protein NI581_002212 [Pseudomonas aeruginosa]|nr:hypothetical protein [Pseudomonas aeruginosa]HCF9199502.1 hypothetical protein [Pseudomonas aeruginosa]HCF9207340.1 hypothetical protein [Pseudomonas aeruginosa]
MAFAISNRCDPRMQDERERRYMEGIKRYSSAEQARFPLIFQALCEAMEAKPGDILGRIFEELGLANADRGRVHAEIRGNFTHSRSNCLIPK